MKLGKFLIRRFGAKKARKRTVAASSRNLKRAVPRSRRRSSGGLFRQIQVQVQTQEVQVRKVRAQVQPVATEPSVTPLPPPRFTPETTLKTVDLLRPSDRLRESIEGFLLDQRSEHTRRAYGKDIKRFLKFLLSRGLGDRPREIDRSVMIAYKDSLLGEGLEHTTVDRHLASLRSFFGWLVDDGLLQKNPAEGVRFMNPKRISKTLGFSDEEVKRVLSVPDIHTRTGALHYAVLMVLFYCGLRRSELCSLRTSSVGRERSHPVLRLRGKGNAERVIVMVPAVWNAIQHYLRITGKELSEDQYLFTPIRNNRTGVKEKPLDSSMVFYIVTRSAKKAGVANRVSPHSCRATAISNARDHQVPDRAIQEFAGWASPDMITRYDKRKSSVENSAAHAIRYGALDRTDPEKPREKSSSAPERDPEPELIPV